MLYWKRFLSSLLVVALCLGMVPSQVFAVDERPPEVLSAINLEAAYDAETGEVTVSEIPSGTAYLILAGYKNDQMLFSESAECVNNATATLSVPKDRIFDMLKVFCLDSSNSPICPAKEFDFSSDDPEIGERYYSSIEENQILLDEESGSTYVAGQLLLVTDSTVNKKYVETLVEPFAGQIVGHVEMAKSYQIEFKQIPTLEELQKIAEKLSQDLHVESCITHQLYECDMTWSLPSDYDDEWDTHLNAEGMNWNMESISVNKAWEYLDTTETIKIGVIDGGFYTKHNDLDFFNDTAWENTFDSTANSFKRINHGNHVAGIIGATWDDIAVAGIVKDAEIYGFSYLSDSKQVKGQESPFLLTYALSLILPHDVKAINFSIGQQSVQNHKMNNSTLKDMKKQASHIGAEIINFLDAGYDFLIVQAAGNDSNDNHPKRNFLGITSYNKQGWVDTKWSSILSQIPQETARNRVIIVGAYSIENNGASTDYIVSSYSNIGDEVDILAPGGHYVSPNEIFGVYSTGGYYLSGYEPNHYYHSIGTSMAAPHVTGVAALVWSVNPALSGQEVKEIILNNYKHTLSLNTANICTAVGHENLNLADEKILGYISNPTVDKTVANQTFLYPMLDAEAAVMAAYYGYNVGAVKCTVVDEETGKYIDAAKITLSNKDETFRDEFFTNDIGVLWDSISINANAPDVLTVTIEADGYTPQEQSARYNIGTHCYDLGEIRLEKLQKHTVMGVVVDSALGTGIEGINLSLLSSADDALLQSVQTDANGTFTIANVLDGTYTIVATKDGYENATVQVTVNGSSVTTPTILMKKRSADLTVTHDILGDILASAAANEATGGIQLCNNVGAANWTVTGATGITKTGDWFDITQTDNGNGSINLEISVKGYTLSRNSGTITFTKEDGSTQTVKVYQKAHTLSGTVVDTNGPVANASVVIWNTDGFRSDSIITGTDGKFSLPVYDANYSITVTTDAYGEKTIDVPTAVNMCDVDAGEIMVAEADIVASGTCGNDLTWSLTADGLLTICGTGSMSYSSYYVPWEAYLEDIISVAVENGVTSIEDNAFRECENLTNVSLADTVTIIGSYAFENCFSLPAITIPGSVTTIEEYAFDDCDSLTSIVIPDSVITIGEGAFSICDELISVTIGAGVESIGLGAFDCGLESITVVPANQYYSSLGTVLFNKDQTELIKYAGDWEINWQYDVPDGVVTIAENAFAHAYRLDRITIPTSVASIGQSALNALNLEEIQVDDTNAYYCSIDGVLFNKAQTELIEYPGGNDRTEYTIPDGVTAISDYAFDESHNLIKVVIPESVTTIGEYAFRLCWDLTTANIPDSVTTVGEGIFTNCSDLVIVDIPKGITSISDKMYYGCSGLTSIIIPNNITTIGGNVFFGWDNLQSVTIGNNVTFIDDWAFDNCDNLTSIYFTGNAPEIGNWYPFDEEVVTLYYVEGTTGWTDSEAYDAENGTWNGYKLSPMNP